MQLNALNIRKGLELEVPIKEIFSNPIEATGNVDAMHVHHDGWEKHKDKYPNLDELFKDDSCIHYTTKKVMHKISDTLTAYVFDLYHMHEDEELEGEIVTHKNTEIEFINTDRLSYFEFCQNVMLAQQFSGLYENIDFKYSFVGFGDFDIDECFESFNIISHSNVHLMNFFIFYKNVLTSLGSIITGLYKNDIKEQKEYLKEKEYKSLLREANKRTKMMEEFMRSMVEDEEDYED